MKVIRRSPFSGQENTMDLDITPAQLDRWKEGALIQNVFPHLSPDEREFLMTGITSTEWAEMFKKGEA